MISEYDSDGENRAELDRKLAAARACSEDAVRRTLLANRKKWFREMCNLFQSCAYAK